MITVYENVCYRAESFDEIVEVLFGEKEVNGVCVGRWQLEVSASYHALLVAQIQLLREEVANLRSAAGLGHEHG